MENKFTLPKWLETLPKHKQPRARARFITQLAALYGTPDGSLSALSSAMGYYERTVSTALAEGRYDRNFPISFISRLESLIGPNIIPREYLNEIFRAPTTAESDEL